jgi:hypothetical protein
MDGLELPRCNFMKVARSGWACKACSSLNEANREQCNKCQVNKKVFITKSGWRQGDWICLGCSNHNWADKLNCNKCFAEPTEKQSERGTLQKVETTLLRKLDERLKQFAEMIEEQIACAKIDIMKEFKANDGLSCKDHEGNDSTNSSSGGSEGAKKKTATKKAAKTLKQLEEIEERFVQREHAKSSISLGPPGSRHMDSENGDNNESSMTLGQPGSRHRNNENGVFTESSMSLGLPGSRHMENENGESTESSTSLGLPGSRHMNNENGVCTKSSMSLGLPGSRHTDNENGVCNKSGMSLGRPGSRHKDNEKGDRNETLAKQFAAGDILQFVDGRETHKLLSSGSEKHCHEKLVRLLKVGTSGERDGWLEVRVLSWEDPERTTKFAVQGWLKPFVNEACILSKHFEAV